MYKVVIVEDEALVVKGLLSKIDWQALDLEVCGVSSNGLEAVKLIEKNAPDIVLTDINMPIMNGLELAELLRSRGNTCEIILLTGYGEFEYARKAIAFGVSEYLMKPCSKRDIEASLKKASSALDGRKSLQCRLKNLEISAATKQEQLKKSLLLPILEQTTPDIGLSVSRFFGAYPQYEGRAYVVAAILPQYEGGDAGERDLDLFAILNIAEELLVKYAEGCAAKTSGKAIALLLAQDRGQTPDQIEQKTTATLGLIQSTVLSFLSISTVAGVGGASDTLCGCGQSLRQSERCLANRAIFATPVITLSDVEGAQAKAELYKKCEEGIFFAIDTCSKEKIRESVDGFFAAIESEKICDIDQLITSTRLFIYKAVNIISAKKVELIDYDDHLTDDFCAYDTLEEYKTHLAKTLDDILFRDTQRYNNIASYIIEFISRNYAKQITLELLAGELYLSPNYLTTLFKKETGSTFKKYLATVRIARAKDLLADIRLKVYEVGALVGYENEEYFCKVFKSISGVTPTEFRSDMRFK